MTQRKLDWWMLKIPSFENLEELKFNSYTVVVNNVPYDTRFMSVWQSKK